MSLRNLTETIFLVVRAKRDNNFQKPWGIDVCKTTKKKPTTVPGDAVVIKVTISIPPGAFDPQEILATIPIDCIRRPVEVLVESPGET